MTDIYQNVNGTITQEFDTYKEAKAFLDAARTLGAFSVYMIARGVWISRNGSLVFPEGKYENEVDWTDGDNRSQYKLIKVDGLWVEAKPADRSDYPYDKAPFLVTFKLLVQVVA